MPLDARILGQTGTPHVHVADARWTMAYAAALGETAPRYLDTRAAVYAHPLFPVCLEWPAVVECRRLMSGAGLGHVEQPRALHAAHDLHIVRPIVAGETLTTLATVVGVEDKRPGTFCTTRLDTRDAAGALVCRTYQLTLLRGVQLAGKPAWLEQPPAPVPAHRPGSSDSSIPIEVPFNAAHVYTECARIWNPIHTDRAVAVAAGLRDIILHGTMTLALAVSHLVAAGLPADAGRIRRIAGRFMAMVHMPSRMMLEVGVPDDRGVTFRVLAESGGEAIQGGYLGWSA